MKKRISYEIVDMDTLGEDKRQDVAHWVAGYLEEEGYEQHKMLKKTPEQVLQNMGMVALLGKDSAEPGQKIGFQGANQPTEDGHGTMAEIGTLFVLGGYQHNGIASALVRAMTKKLRDAEVTPYAFCNENSLPVMQAAGLSPASTADVPACALEDCNGCSAMKAGLVQPGQCCDTIMVYEPGGIV